MTWINHACMQGLRRAHLCLRQAEWRRQLGPLGQCQILRLLKPPLESRQLEAGINGSRFSDFLWFSIHHPDLWLALLFLCRAQADICVKHNRRRRVLQFLVAWEIEYIVVYFVWGHWNCKKKKKKMRKITEKWSELRALEISWTFHCVLCPSVVAR